MTFQVIPAIDVVGGRLARLSPDGPVAIDAFGGDPLVAARACLEAGATLLHVVDMDLAFSGEARNAGVLRSIVALGARVPGRRRGRGGAARSPPRSMRGASGSSWDRPRSSTSPRPAV